MREFCCAPLVIQPQLRTVMSSFFGAHFGRAVFLGLNDPGGTSVRPNTTTPAIIGIDKPGFPDLTENSVNNTVLGVCGVETMDTCYQDYGWKYGLVALSSLSLIVTLFHLMVLQRVPPLYGSSYLFVLRQISVAEIYASVHLLNILCPFHQLYLGKDIRIAAMVATVNNHSSLMQYTVLTVACLERYLSVCRPLVMATAEVWTRKHLIKSISAFFWVTSLSLCLTKNFVFHKELCLLPLHGPSTPYIKTPTAGILIIGYIGIITITMICCHIKVALALRQRDARARSSQFKKSQYTKQSAQFVIAIHIVYYICVGPAVIFVTTMAFGRPVTAAKYIVKIFCVLYGLIHILIFERMTKAYRSIVLKFLKRSNKTAPPTLNGKLRDVSGRMQQHTVTIGQKNNRPVAMTDVSVFVVSYDTHNMKETTL